MPNYTFLKGPAFAWETIFHLRSPFHQKMRLRAIFIYSMKVYVGSGLQSSTGVFERSLTIA